MEVLYEEQRSETVMKERAMERRLVSLVLAAALLLSVFSAASAEALSVAIGSCSVENGGTASVGDTVTFEIAATHAKRTQLMIVPPDSSRVGMEGPVCAVRLTSPGTWAFVAYAQDDAKHTVHSEQWRIHVEGGRLPDALISDEERYINHFFTEDFSRDSQDGLRLRHWLDYTEKTDVASRNNSGYLMLEEEMVYQDGFWQKVGAGFVSGSKLALETVSNFGLNLALDLVNHLQWKEIFPETGWYAVPYYTMLSGQYAEYLQSTTTILSGFDEAADSIFSNIGDATDAAGDAWDLLDTQAVGNAIIKCANDLPTAQEVRQTIMALYIGYNIDTTKFKPLKDGQHVPEQVPRSTLREHLDDRVEDLSVALSEKAGAVEQVAKKSREAGKKIKNIDQRAVSDVLAVAGLEMAWADFASTLQNCTAREQLLMTAFLSATLEQVTALQTWRDDIRRYGGGKTSPLEEALDLLIAQILTTAYQDMSDYRDGVPPQKLAQKMSSRSFWSAAADTVIALTHFDPAQLLERMNNKGFSVTLKSGPLDIKLTDAGKASAAFAVVGVGSFVLNLLDSVSGYSEWRDTVKQLYVVKRSLSNSVIYQLEAYRSDPCYERAVTLIESLELLKYLKQAGEKTIMLNFLGNAFPDLSPAAVSVLLCELLRDNDQILVCPAAGFRQIEVVEYRDLQAVYNQPPRHSNARIMGYYRVDDTQASFMGRQLEQCPPLYQTICKETDSPSRMDEITAVDGSWLGIEEKFSLDISFVLKEHQRIDRYMPKRTDYIRNPKTGEMIPIETYDYDESLFEGDSGYFHELAHGTVYAYVHPDIAITLTKSEYTAYQKAEKEIADKLRIYQQELSHTDKEAAKHQLEERWIWSNVTGAYIESVEMFDRWLSHNP